MQDVGRGLVYRQIAKASAFAFSKAQRYTCGRIALRCFFDIEELPWLDKSGRKQRSITWRLLGRFSISSVQQQNSKFERLAISNF